MFMSYCAEHLILKQYRNNPRIVYNYRIYLRQMPSPSSKTTIVVISKSGTLSECQVEPQNDTTLQELTILLSKKCGYRNHDGFSCYHTWRYKNKHSLSFDLGGSHADKTITPKYIYIDIWGKTDGRAGNENKYELPPPIDELLFFGNLALVARVDKECAVNLSIKLWTKVYEKLFGGFEDLAVTAAEDENEVDELSTIPASMKTINGYFKDGFVVDDDSEDTPRAKVKSSSKKRNTKSSAGGSKGKKNKSESTESEFVTETETESGSLPSDSPITSETEAEAEAEVAEPSGALPQPATRLKKDSSKPKRTIKKPCGTNKPKKQVVEEVAQPEEIESELSEDSYD
jgi:hypothetical protein